MSPDRRRKQEEGRKEITAENPEQLSEHSSREREAPQAWLVEGATTHAGDRRKPL
jgi:hypothetical protein